MASWSDTPSPKLETPAKRKLKFSYNTPTPTLPQKKQRLESESSSSSLDAAKDFESDPPALEYVDAPEATNHIEQTTPSNE